MWVIGYARHKSETDAEAEHDTGSLPDSLINPDVYEPLRCVKAWGFWPRSCKLLNCSQMPKAYCFAYETW